MRGSTLKGWFHVSLVVAAAAEAFSSKSKIRTALLGACAGWHAIAVYEHFVREPKEKLPYVQHDEELHEYLTWLNRLNAHEKRFSD